ADRARPARRWRARRGGRRRRRATRRGPSGRPARRRGGGRRAPRGRGLGAATVVEASDAGGAFPGESITIESALPAIEDDDELDGNAPQLDGPRRRGGSPGR